MGVTISNNVKWEAHTAAVTSKAGKRLDVLSLLIYKADRETLNTMYLSFVLSILEYSDVIPWCSNLSERQMYNLEAVHKRAG